MIALRAGGNDGSTRPSRVVICNAYSDDNRGSAALTIAAIELVRNALPGCQISILALGGLKEGVDHAFRHTKQRFPDADVLATPLRVSSAPLSGLAVALKALLLLAVPNCPGGGDALRRIRDADLVVSRGGVIFFDRDVRGLLALLRTAFPILLASRLDIPTILLGAHMGPFRSRLSRWLHRRIASSATLIFPRDARSRAWAETLTRHHRRIHQMPDSVFILEPSHTDRVDNCLDSAGVRSRRFGVLTISGDCVESPTYPMLQSSLKDVVARLLDAGAIDRIVIVVQVDGPDGSDLAASQRLFNDLADPRCVLISEDLSPTEFMALYARSSFVLGCRLHSTIFGLIGGIPAFPIAAARSLGVEKAEGVFASLDLQEWVVDYPAFEPVALVEIVSDALDSPTIGERITDVTERARREVESMSGFLAEVVR